MSQQQPKKRGRPKKKGRPAWRPANMLDVVNKPDGYRVRWVNKDEMNLQKKEAEGWIYANSENGFQMNHLQPKKVEGGEGMTSIIEYRGMVLMALPEEIAEARDEYIREKTEQQTAGLKRQLERNLEEGADGKPAETYGKIVIE